GVLAAAALAAGMDALLAGAVAGLIEVAARLALWGRRARPTRAALVAALAAGAWIAAGAAAAAVAALVARRNRYLAGGVVMVATTAVALVVAALAPALARLLSGRRARQAPPPPAGRGARLLVLAPLGVIAVEMVVFAAAARARAPLGN